jgi:hypothetical protein
MGNKRIVWLAVAAAALSLGVAWPMLTEGGPSTEEPGPTPPAAVRTAPRPLPDTPGWPRPRPVEEAVIRPTADAD